jgi:Flp pilus assembly protein TadD
MGRRADKRRVVEMQEGAAEDSLLVPRAYRVLRRGDDRRAMLLLREAACRSASDARLWTLYGVQCARMGRGEDAEQALRQALWLRQRARDESRVRVMERLLDQVRQGLRTLRAA